LEIQQEVAIWRKSDGVFDRKVRSEELRRLTRRLRIKRKYQPWERPILMKMRPTFSEQDLLPPSSLQLTGFDQPLSLVLASVNEGVMIIMWHGGAAA
jgi:hypothetical protein